jgi:outer membrane protein assembly factor BamB
MGPTRDGVWPEDGVLDAFPPGGPKQRWKVESFGGYSGPAVVNGRVFHFDYRRTAGDDTASPAKKNKLEGKERIACFDAATGDLKWKHEYHCPYEVSYPAGPRCTPTVHAGKVYALGTMGHLTCLDAATGNTVWKTDLRTAYAAEVPLWGYSGHPLVYKNTLLCLVGGKGGVVAFDLATGKEAWKTGTPAEPGYAPPAVVTAHGRDEVIAFSPTHLTAFDPGTGAKRWAVDIKPQYGMSIMAPVWENGTLFAAGFGAAVAVRPAADGPPEVLWTLTKKSGVGPVNMTPVVIDGVVYGVDQPGQMRAVRLATGERLWESFAPVLDEDKPAGFMGGGSGTAFVVRNADRAFVFNERGTLQIAKLTPAGYAETGRAKLIDPSQSVFGRRVVWSHPAFAGRCVFVRNDKELACYSLAK